MDRSPEPLESYFDSKFTSNPDPWNYEESWYEARKRAVLLAALPRALYDNAFEPGCANGFLSAELAQRCGHLLCADFSPRAVAIARARLRKFANVNVRRLVMPRDWPVGKFDLIVVSEFAYYLDIGECTVLAQHAASSLANLGVLASCHWRHGGELWMLNSARVHSIFTQAAEDDALHTVVHIEDTDFLLDVWTRDAQSVALREHNR
ncbi:nodulation protein S (NodS) [Paraburkholderia unamae]|uniref:SAM-dependent methyltransferase n=1 Tax=Paraburkholderia unamae TaxID=219649 RepID=UPI000DC309D4|nr:class I SAM-dependent methyltransferase [Paraburkholderia unamae]RAR54632.1 nodulation protein S (NodS) [Paraburkholderia unamae]